MIETAENKYLKEKGDYIRELPTLPKFKLVASAKTWTNSTVILFPQVQHQYSTTVLLNSYILPSDSWSTSTGHWLMSSYYPIIFYWGI